MPPSSDFEFLLRRAALRVTRPRVAVLTAVHEHPHADTDSIIGVVRETPSGEMRVLPHAEKARNEADAMTIIDRITSQIEEGSFQPRGTDLEF